MATLCCRRPGEDESCKEAEVSASPPSSGAEAAAERVPSDANLERRDAHSQNFLIHCFAHTVLPRIAIPDLAYSMDA